MNVRPGVVTWEQPGGDTRSERFDHVLATENGGVAAYETDDLDEYVTDKLLELGPAVPWVVDRTPEGVA